MSSLIHLGDLRLTLPGGVAVGAWLLGARAWRLAIWWGALFALALGLVGASKIAFMGWGGGLPALNFKSVSGHAAGVSALAPTLFYLLGGKRPAFLAGVGLGLLVGVLLVTLGEHSAAEAAAGCLLGAGASAVALALGGPMPPQRPLPSVCAALLAYLVSAWLMQSVHIGYWMIKAARLLSGNQQIYPLSID